MNLTNDNLATIEFKAQWEHDGIRHTDSLWAQRVNMWRDVFPPTLHRQLMSATAGDAPVVELVGDGHASPPRPENVVRVPLARLQPFGPAGLRILPRYGRFYPAGILAGLPGVFKESITPFRCISRDEAAISADLNHAMAGRSVRLTAAVRDVREKFEERGGTANAWVETLLEGPGFKARANGRPTDFFSDAPFERPDAVDDSVFYARPRLVNHIDDTAVLYLNRLYGQLIRPKSRVLDLMSSWVSHLPEGLELEGVTGLGMNREELAANRRLTDAAVHDLNRDPVLPFASGAFDAAVCTVSVEYLTRPFEVFKEVARVLRNGGVFIVTFSNRWFPPKAIRIWPQLHEFERVGLVTEYFLKSGDFSDLETWSMRGLPRPVNDRYYSQQPFSDPLHAVWGYRT
ncbi:MAG: methyltransferase domain-containing protein [Pseudomonadota bacterium]